MRVKVLNPQAFLEFLCFSILGGLLFDLVRSQKYLSYVTPKMAPYLYFTSIVMLIWAFDKLRMLFCPQHKLRSSHCFILGIPILFLLLPHNPLTTSTFSINTANKPSLSYIKESEVAAISTHTHTLCNDMLSPDNSSIDTNVSSDSKVSFDSEDPSEAELFSNDFDELSGYHMPGLDTVKKEIIISNDDFSRWLTELRLSKEKYLGYHITITGYVYKDPNVDQDHQFVIARLMMSCCVTDLTPAGILCEYEKCSLLNENSWLTIEGILQVQKKEYQGQSYEEPLISVIQVTPADEVKEYVYPFT